MLSSKKTNSRIADLLETARPAFHDGSGLLLGAALDASFRAGGQHALEGAIEEIGMHASALESEAGKIAFAWVIDILRKRAESEEEFHEEYLRELSRDIKPAQQ